MQVARCYPKETSILAWDPPVFAAPSATPAAPAEWRAAAPPPAPAKSRHLEIVTPPNPEQREARFEGTLALVAQVTHISSLRQNVG